MCERVTCSVFAERRRLVKVLVVRYVRRNKILFVTLSYAVNTQLIHNFHPLNINIYLFNAIGVTQSRSDQFQLKLYRLLIIILLTIILLKGAISKHVFVHDFKDLVGSDSVPKTMILKLFSFKLSHIESNFKCQL